MLTLTTTVLSPSGDRLTPPHSRVTVEHLTERWFVSDVPGVDRPEDVSNRWEWSFHANQEAACASGYPPPVSDTLARWEYESALAMRICANTDLDNESRVKYQDIAARNALAYRLSFLGGSL